MSTKFSLRPIIYSIPAGKVVSCSVSYLVHRMCNTAAVWYPFSFKVAVCKCAELMGFIDSLSIIKLQGHKDFNIHVQFCCLKTFNLNVDQWKFRVGGGGVVQSTVYIILYIHVSI